MKIPVGISKRHVHLTKEVYEKLFGHTNIKVRNYLNQPGEYASTDVVNIKWNNKILERARIIGPFRSYNQVEISRSDASYLEINPEARQSGDLNGTLPVILEGPNGEINLDKGLIIAERHIHINEELSKKFNLKNKEKVLIYKDGNQIYDAFIKVVDPSYLELHLDVDEALKYDLLQNDEVEIYKIQE